MGNLVLTQSLYTHFSVKRAGSELLPTEMCVQQPRTGTLLEWTLFRSHKRKVYWTPAETDLIALVKTEYYSIASLRLSKYGVAGS